MYFYFGIAPKFCFLRKIAKFKLISILFWVNFHFSVPQLSWQSTTLTWQWSMVRVHSGPPFRFFLFKFHQILLISHLKSKFQICPLKPKCTYFLKFNSLVSILCRFLGINLKIKAQRQPLLCAIWEKNESKQCKDEINA